MIIDVYDITCEIVPSKGGYSYFYIYNEREYTGWRERSDDCIRACRHSVAMARRSPYDHSNGSVVRGSNSDELERTRSWMKDNLEYCDKVWRNAGKKQGVPANV